MTDPITAREALELAANRLDRVVLDQEFGSERRYVVSEWADEARASAAALSVQPAREGLREILTELQSVLCDPEGRCCIDGSDGDRAAVDGALAQLAALSAAPAPVRKCHEQGDGNFPDDCALGSDERCPRCEPAPSTGEG